MKSIRIAVVGATGLVGTTVLKILEERNYVQILEAEKSGVGRKPSPLVLVNPDALKEDL